MNNIIWNKQLLYSAMAGSRNVCKNKNYSNHNSMNGLFLIVYMMALIFPTYSMIETESNKISCSDSISCTKCTINSMCVWSLKQQKCENKNLFNSSSLIVSSIGNCPQFSIVKKYEYYNHKNNKYISVDYIVEITNDLVGFINYLSSIKIYYSILNGFESQTEIFNKTKILCSFKFLRSNLNVNVPTATYFIYIKFNDIMLRFDNIVDNYVTFYDHEECTTDEKYKSCATCGWNKEGYSNYLKWCSSENTCKVRNGLYMKNNATNQLLEKVAYVTNDCADINVTTVNPLSGPKTGGTTVTITVRNHMIFVEKRTFTVMVAGTICTNPKTLGIETITCITSQSVGAPSGPIVVEYSSIESTLKIESSQIFRFCLNPILDAYQLLEGVVSGDTSVPVHGNHFVEPCVISSARMYVDLPDGVRWYANVYCDPPVNDTFMVCRTPRMTGVRWDGNQTLMGQLFNFGLDVMKFAGNQSIHVNGTSLHFYASPDPVLEDFVIDDAGSVVINGFNLGIARLHNIVVQSLNSSATGFKVVSVKSKRIVCDPTMMTVNPAELQKILVKIGDSLSYILVNRSPTPIVDPFNLPISKNMSTLPDSNKTSCSDSMTCTKCTIKPMCIWSLQQQACENKTQFNSSGLIVIRIEECPRFSVKKEYNYSESSVSLKYTVKLSNDLVGFRNYLSDSIIYNRFPTYCKNPTRDNTYNGTIISCDFYVNKSYFDQDNPSFTFFTFIQFNNVMLRFDNVADHYDTFYEQEECANDEKYKSCATCAWNNDGYSNYLRLCPSNNTCQVHENLYMKNNGKDQLNGMVAYITNDCAEINVTAVNPLSGPETGGTTVTITVRNHGMIAENRTVMVTVAGTVCLNPRTSGPETITCTTSQSNKTLSGPILVEYSSIENVLKIESSQMFQFCLNPVLKVDQQLEGVASGGTSVPVRGDHFIEPCFAFIARLYVDLDDGVRRYAVCDSPINNTYMVCRSPNVNETDWDGDVSVMGRLLNFGLDITFSNDNLSLNQSPPIEIRNPSLRFYVHPDPLLLDYEIDENGSVVVNGLHLQHVRFEDITIRSLDSQSSICVVVSVTPHSLVCEPTTTVNASQVISVTLGDSLVYTVSRKMSPHSDAFFKLPVWRIAMITTFTVLVFVCPLVFWLRMKHRYSETEEMCIHNLPGAPTSLQDLDKHTSL